VNERRPVPECARGLSEAHHRSAVRSPARRRLGSPFRRYRSCFAYCHHWRGMQRSTSAIPASPSLLQRSSRTQPSWRSFLSCSTSSRRPTQIDAPRCGSSQWFLWEPVAELSGDVALEAADGCGFGLAVGETALEVAPCVRIVGEPADRDPAERRGRLAVAGAAEPVSLLLPDDASWGRRRRPSAISATSRVTACGGAGAAGRPAAGNRRRQWTPPQITAARAR
jgi:hypothetical protein